MEAAARRRAVALNALGSLQHLHAARALRSWAEATGKALMLSATALPAPPKKVSPLHLAFKRWATPALGWGARRLSKVCTRMQT